MKNLQMTLLLIFLANVLASSVAEWVDPPPKFQCPDRPLFPCNCTKGSEEGIYLECTNTNLASLSLGLKQVKTLIHTLKITNCNMEKLYGNLFQLQTIKHLYIEDTPIKDISDGTFDGIAESLEELHIRNSWLTRMSPSIKNLTHLKILEVDKSRIKYLPPGVFDGMKKLVDLKLSDSRVDEVTNKVFQGLVKLKRLSLYKNNLKTLPRNTFKSQGNLEYLDISYNNISKLQPHFFPELRKLLWLNISHNVIPQVNGRIFSRNGLIRVLHLNGNKLTSLDANSLRGMRFMRRLYFSDNQITRVGRGTFRSVSRIGTVDLARNNLTKVDFQMFSDLRFIDTIDLAENQIKEVGKEAFKHIYLTKVNLSYNLIEELGPGIFIGAENMTLLDLSHNKLYNIIPEAFDENSYTSEWRLMFNDFTSMTQIPMKFQKGIRVLNVSYNRIEDIPKNSFPKLFELHTIDFSHNELADIGRSVFSQLFSLRNLNFTHNKLTTLHSYTFGKLPSLLRIDLSHNKLGRIRRGVLAGLASVRAVQLNNNEITDIPSPPISLTHMYLAHNMVTKIKGRQPWPTMNSLLFLDLDYNSLGDSLTGGRFDNLNTLGTLKLRGNNITKPPWEALGALQSLRMLYLDDNMMTNLTRKSFGRLPVVSVLGLSRNNINNITTNAFEGLLQITELDLSHNNLTYIPPGAFQSLVAVRKINLAHNKLERLQNKTHGLFEDCLSIRELDLSHNMIPFVTRKMFPESKWIPYKLEKIDLSFNRMPVLTKEILTGTKHLKHLNISYNILNDIRKGILKKLQTLEVLDISGNVLTNKILMEDGRFEILPNLTVFNLHHNRFSDIPILQIVQLKKLRKLDLSYNRFEFFHPELTQQIKLQLDVFYEGNPLQCNCYLRPISYWLTSVGRVKGRGQSWDLAKCQAPKYLEGVPVGTLIEQQLICEDAADAKQFRLNPDVKFRRFNQEENKLEFSWFVNTNEDVGDFRLELRTKKFPPTTLFEKDISYDTRYQVLDQVPGGEELNLCLLVKNSAGRIRRWRHDQCKRVGPFNGQISLRSGWTTLAATLTLAISRLL